MVIIADESMDVFYTAAICCQSIDVNFSDCVVDIQNGFKIWVS